MDRLPGLVVLAGVVRLVHPFPSALNAIVTAVLVLLAGGSPSVAARLGVAMLALQAAIGSTNDLADVALDTIGKPTKPIPAGIVPRPVARAVAIVGLGIGLSLSALSGPGVFLIGVLGTGSGLLYNFALKDTVWSWLPFGLGVPLLPIYAWLGGSGRLPAPFLILVPLAVLAGAALALGNSLADLERDRASGRMTAAVRLGRDRAWLIGAAALLGIAVAAVATLAGLGAAEAGPPLGVVAVSVVVLGAGLALGRRGDPARREWAWELEAVGVGLLGAGWLAALASAGLL